MLTMSVNPLKIYVSCLVSVGYNPVMMMSSVVLTQYISVTDRRTDRHLTTAYITRRMMVKIFNIHRKTDGQTD